jgi:hypothetical protein
MEITINLKQTFALVWIVIAIMLSLIVVLAMGWPYSFFGSYYSVVPWLLMIAAFF